MKTLSLKLDEKIFTDMEAIIVKRKVARNRYINDALGVYNLFNQRKMLKKKLAKESAMVMANSMEILRELEAMDDEIPEWD
jgi:hypothetical protein